ncbi:MAG: hypothetical protein JRN57_01070 [Nitrososphaerota archaeon]|nr:hypothetical protein [Nitrososphaerota archaeon]MDG7010686.1 hypothetical protein [Nitrososphaerota archaeon]
MVARRRLIALAVFVVPWVFWILAIGSASSHGFFENEWAVQTMVLGGAISMVAGAIASFW